MIPRWATVLLFCATLVVLGVERGFGASVIFGAGVVLFYVLATLPTSREIALALRIIIALTLIAYLLWRGAIELLALTLIGAAFLSLTLWTVNRVRR
ncbi:hypothetical protein [Hyphomonas oceanitis]|uniref:hypothetical protein n=1 Tax=Hyphomonas oceanitis TaxID=81033 RepID=UPI003002C593